MSKAWSARGADYEVSPLHRQGPSLAKLLALVRPQTSDLCLDIGTGLEYEGTQAVRLEVPLALILALKPI